MPAQIFDTNGDALVHQLVGILQKWGVLSVKFGSMAGLALRSLPRLPLPHLLASRAGESVRGWQPPACGHRPLVILSQVAWDDVWQRPQEHAMRAAAHRTVIYLSPVQIHEWQRNLVERYEPVRMPLGSNGRLLVLSPLTLPGHYKTGLAFSWNMAILRRWLIAALERLGMLPDGGLDVLLNTPLLLPLVEGLENRGRLKGARIHYDMIDDFAGFEWAPRFSRNLDRRLLDRALSLTTGTRELARRLQSARPDAVFVPLGVDAEGFGRVAPVPADLQNLPRPWIGYFGTISDRLDYGLLDAVAAAYPNGTLILIGPVRVAAGVLPDRPNVRLMGLRPHGELPAYAQAFDVGLIPFRVNAANRALNPVKALEYLAAGLPVVSADLPDVRALHVPPVFVAHQAEEQPGVPTDARSFLAAIGEALALRADPDRLEAYQREARAHAKRFTWDGMARELERRMGVEWP
jgi:glycosyltransferase involved in cell wall biosynthesis